MWRKFKNEKILLAGILGVLGFYFLWFGNTSPLPSSTPAVPVQTTPQNLVQPLSAAANTNLPSATNRLSASARLAASNLGHSPAAAQSVIVSGDGQISANALKQIGALMAEKARLTPIQKKIGSQLLDADKMRRGEPVAEGVATQRTDLDHDAQGRILVDIRAEVTPLLLQRIADLGGKVVSSFPEYSTIQAGVPLAEIETLAVEKSVATIQPAMRATHSNVDSEGDYAHQANTARASFGVTGSGVKVGVISDSVDHLTGSQVDGLVTVVSNMSGLHQGNTGEGTAMLEIVNDLAPGASLYFASDGASEAQFAANIRNLRFTQGCDIIVDDLLYQDESPFQDGIVAQAVNEVTADGALYFSAAGNSGNQDSGTSGTWEGDFADGGQAPAKFGMGRIHSFGSANYNAVLTGGSSFRMDLFWADPWDASTNDYDVYVLDANGNSVLASSRNPQDGGALQDPYEHVSTIYSGERIVIVKYAGASRFLHLDTGRGRLNINTAGATRGHSCATNAFGIAATDAYTSYPNAFTGGSFNPVEDFSSDGPRRVFFQADGTPITPGNFLATGGTVRSKPDLTAADGVMTDVVGFRPFYGTSAAAPHAAAIAVLVKSYTPSLTASEIRAILTNAILDIMADGYDRDSGSGILMAPIALTGLTDGVKPTVSITSPKPNQFWSNGVFTVTGKASDNVAISNVFCAVNGGGWLPVSTADDWVNWTAQATLLPGTNLIAAYAVDTTGNRSLTNTVRLVYVASDVLVVHTNGSGSIKPDYNGVVLPIGQSYTLTATAAKGFAFSGWTGGVTTNVAKLIFKMATNLTLNANFRDVTRPTLSITNFKSGQKWSNSVFAVKGKASDNAAVGTVFYSLNGGEWQSAFTANAWTNWTALVILFSGNNALRAFAVDATGNVSVTNSISIVCTTADPAPASLKNLLAIITPDGGNPFAVGFGTNQFSQTSTDTNGDNGVGNYAYTKLATNTARLVINYTAPPTITNDSTAVIFNFNDNQTGTFSNELNGLVTGGVTFAPATNFAPTTLSGKKIRCLDDQTNVISTLVFGSANFTQTNAVTVSVGSYLYRAYGPVGGLVTLVSPTGTNFLTLHFTSTTAGNFFNTFYDNLGGSPVLDSGTFTGPVK